MHMIVYVCERYGHFCERVLKIAYSYCEAVYVSNVAKGGGSEFENARAPT